MTTEAAVKSDSNTGPVDVELPLATWPAGLKGIVDSLASASVAETLDVLVRLAWMAFRADAAGVLLVGDDIAASVASGADARRADALQIDNYQGPGLQAISGRQPVVSPELRFDSRWRFWAPQAADLGFRSVLSLALVDGDPFGAITLYSKSPSSFGTELLAPGLEFAAQASVAIAAALSREQVLQADTPDGAGQSPTSLSRPDDFSPDDAIAMLRRPSSVPHRKPRSTCGGIGGVTSRSTAPRTRPFRGHRSA